MIWQTVLDVIDAVESWIAGQSYWVQVVVLLAVLGPLCYLLAGAIDRMVEAVLARHSRRDLAPAVPDPNLAVLRPPDSDSGGPAVPAAVIQTTHVETGNVAADQGEDQPATTAQPGTEHAKAGQ